MAHQSSCLPHPDPSHPVPLWALQAALRSGLGPGPTTAASTTVSRITLSGRTVPSVSSTCATISCSPTGSGASITYLIPIGHGISDPRRHAQNVVFGQSHGEARCGRSVRLDSRNRLSIHPNHDARVPIHLCGGARPKLRLVPPSIRWRLDRGTDRPGDGHQERHTDRYDAGRKVPRDEEHRTGLAVATGRPVTSWPGLTGIGKLAVHCHCRALQSASDAPETGSSGASTGVSVTGVASWANDDPTTPESKTRAPIKRHGTRTDPMGVTPSTLAISPLRDPLHRQRSGAVIPAGASRSPPRWRWLARCPPGASRWPDPSPRWCWR
jgi:hypothetical protein